MDKVGFEMGSDILCSFRVALITGIPSVKSVQYAPSRCGKLLCTKRLNPKDILMREVCGDADA